MTAYTEPIVNAARSFAPNSTACCFDHGITPFSCISAWYCCRPSGIPGWPHHLERKQASGCDVAAVASAGVGAKTALLIYAEGDVAQALRGAAELDRQATAALVARLVPGLDVVSVEDGNLDRNINPSKGLSTQACSRVSPSFALLS